MRAFDKRYNSIQYKLKFYLPYHVAESLLVFCTLSVLNASSFDQYSVQLRKASRRALRRKSACMNETASMVGGQSDGLKLIQYDL